MLNFSSFADALGFAFTSKIKITKEKAKGHQRPNQNDNKNCASQGAGIHGGQIAE
jgi:hypothetical protein